MREGFAFLALVFASFSWASVCTEVAITELDLSRVPEALSVERSILHRPRLVPWLPDAPDSAFSLLQPFTFVASQWRNGAEEIRGLVHVDPTRSADTWEILNLGVLKRSRRKGIGSQLLDRIVEAAQTEANRIGRKIHLVVDLHPQQFEAIAFLTEHDFKRDAIGPVAPRDAINDSPIRMSRTIDLDLNLPSIEGVREDFLLAEPAFWSGDIFQNAPQSIEISEFPPVTEAIGRQTLARALHVERLNFSREPNRDLILRAIKQFGRPTEKFVTLAVKGDDRHLGHTMGHMEEGKMTLFTLAVLPAYFPAGLERKILEGVKKEARRNGISQVQIHLHRNSERLFRVLEANGFKKVGIPAPDHVTLNYDVEP